MSFQRLSEGVEGKSRWPESGWKVAPQSRTGGRETPVTELPLSVHGILVVFTFFKFGYFGQSDVHFSL